VSEDVQAQLDEFARQLAALTAKFEMLQREAGQASRAAQPSVVPDEVPAWLQPLDDLFWSGEHKKALRMAEEVKGWGLDRYPTERLEELLAYLRRIDTPEWKRRDDLIYVIEHNLGDRRAPQPAASRQPFPTPSAQPASAEAPAQPPAAPREPRPPRQRPQFELDLLGPRALAIAGGIVTLLGIVFFFVLAVNRGWIGPNARVTLGAIAASLVFGSGLELKRRYGTTYSTLAAVAAGMAGGYATLLSAAALYHMLSDWQALFVAVAIAAVGLVTAIAWRSQIVGGIGLLGAMIVPAFISAQGGVRVLPVAFVAVVFAVLAGVSIWLGWRWLLVAGGLASVPQLLALTFAPKYAYQSPHGVLALVALFFGLYAATGIGRQLRIEATTLDPVASAFILGGGLVAAGSFARLFATGDQRGTALLVVGAVYAVPGAFFFQREQTRDLSAQLMFATFTLIAVASALLLHGDALAYAWAAEAAGLAWLAATVREIRYQLWSAVYLALALVHAIVDAPPHHLVDLVADRAAGVGTIVAVAAAAAVFSFYARPWSDDGIGSEERLLADVYAALAEAHRKLRAGAAWLSLVLSTYALSLGVLAVFSSFAWGTVANAGVWMTIGCALLAGGFWRDSPHLRLGSLIWLTATGAGAVAQAARVLDGNPRAVAIAAVGAAWLVTSVVYGLSRHEGIDEKNAVSGAAAAIALGLLIYPIAYSLDGRREGAALLGLAALYAVISAILHRRPARNPSTVFWALAVGVAAAADVLLLNGTYAVLGWAVAGVAVGWIARHAAEPRLQLGAAALVGLVVVWAFAIQAPPTHLFTTRLHPAYGTASIFIAAAAVAALAFFARAELGRVKFLRTAPRWLAGGLAVYGLSLLILELVEGISSTGLHTEFQRGQTAVSAFWGLLGLGLLYAGLKRWSRPLRIAGLAFFPISLAKIFLFDLPSLSSVTRALSFLAVGAVLLLGGFFYQRLMSDRDEPPPSVPAA